MGTAGTEGIVTGATVTTRTASRHPPIGEAGRNVIANIERLRAARHLSLRQLSERLGELGRPILTSQVHRLVHGLRRVDADDLVALGQVLDVTPAALLAPGAAREVPGHASLSAAQDLAARIEGLLTAPDDPVARKQLARSVKRALSRVRLEVDELLDNEKGAQ